MKRALLAVGLFTVFISCKEPATPPATVLENMFTAMKSGNIDDMKKHITKQDVAMLETAEKIVAKIDKESVDKIKARITEEFKKNADKFSYTVVNEKIDGDKATVEVELTDAEAPDKKSTHNFELVKEDNAWKLALSKPGNEMFNSMKGNMGERNQSLKDGVEKLEKMNPDSLKMLLQKGVQALDSMDAKKKN